MALARGEDASFFFVDPDLALPLPPGTVDFDEDETELGEAEALRPLSLPGRGEE